MRGNPRGGRRRQSLHGAAGTHEHSRDELQQAVDKGA